MRGLYDDMISQYCGGWKGALIGVRYRRPLSLSQLACRPLFGLKISEAINWNGLKLERQQIVLNIVEDLQTFLGIEELIIRVKRCFVVTRGRSAVAGLPPIKYNINGL